MTQPVNAKEDMRVDRAWNRLTHTMARTMPAQLVQIANARRSINGLFQGRK